MAVYGTFLYGTVFYGAMSFPTSDPWDIFDFCEPSDVTMLTILSWSGVTVARSGGIYTWFSGANDYCMMSNDGMDSGFRFDYEVPHSEFSIQFSFLPTALPEDFSSPVDKRFFVGAFNQFGKCAGLLMSEEGGFALSTDGVTVSSVFPDSADIFSEGADYYIVRVTVDEANNRANLYVTRKDVYDATGVMELRYTFEPLDTPAIEVDNVRVEVVGQAGADTTQICLDCIRLSSSLVLGNQRPVAIIGPDQARVITQYGYFDGRDSYDPDTPAAPLTHVWTTTDLPDASGAKLTGTGTTPADATGYTNIITGVAGTFTGALEGDLLIGDLPLDSIIMRVADDGSWIALNRDAMVAGSASAEWEIVVQSGWGGTRLTGTTMIDVIDRHANSSTIVGPSVGDKYLVIPTALNDFATHEGQIATWGGAAWTFETLDAGLMVFVVAELDGYRTAGSKIWRLSDPKVWELDLWEGRTSQVGSYLGDVLGLYTVQLVVNDGVRDSLPAVALLNIYQTNVPLGLTPDLSFIWNYLPDVWGIVDDKDKVDTFWSGAAQGSTDELMKLWQASYSKSLLDIQRTLQRRWLDFDPWYEEPNYEELPATIENAVNAAGFADAPTPVAVVGDLAVDPEYAYVLNSFSGTGDTITPDSPVVGTATLDHAAGAFASSLVGQEITIADATDPDNNGSFVITAVNSDIQIEYENVNAVLVTEAFTYTASDMPGDALPGHYLVLEGIAYRVTRIEGATFITSHALPLTNRPGYWMLRPTVLSRDTNFTLIGASAHDSAVFEVRTEEGGVIEIPAAIFGVRGKVLVFDDATSIMSAYLASDTYTVRFKGVLRRTAIAVDDVVQNIPRLQEAVRLIDKDGVPVPGVPSPLIEGNDFRVEQVSTVEDV